MRAPLFNLLGLIGTWQLIDISSGNALRAGVAPVIFILFLISSLLWLLVTFGRDPHSGQSHFIAEPAARTDEPDDSNGNSSVASSAS